MSTPDICRFQEIVDIGVQDLINFSSSADVRITKIHRDLILGQGKGFFVDSVCNLVPVDAQQLFGSDGPIDPMVAVLVLSQIEECRPSKHPGPYISIALPSTDKDVEDGSDWTSEEMSQTLMKT
jgi:hypothetical protein